MQDLPDSLYCVDSVVQLEQAAIQQYGIPAYELMKRAGTAVFNIIQTRYSQSKKLLVLCGAGNNAGDGYVVARLARQAGYEVRVITLVEPATLKNEASMAYQDWLQQFASKQERVAVTAVITGDDKERSSWLDDAEVVVDAILGTGITRDVSALWSSWIQAVNQLTKPVISVDIPSGLFADTGHIAGTAIQATVTVCFIGLKQGMFTNRGNDVCGEVIFDNLSIPNEVYTHVQPDAQLVKSVDYSLLAKRKASSHKGIFGHVLIVGGNHGMPGAVILAARAALRTGAGLVTIITIPQHLEAISSAVPEAMVKTCTINAEDGFSIDELFDEPFIDHVTHVAIGMGLGQDDWSLQLLQHCLQLHKPMLIDADALNLIAKHDLTASDFSKISPLVITPHPGEAGRLLSKSEIYSTADVQKDRFTAVKKLHAMFHGHESCSVILKGSGTLIFDGRATKVCCLGSAAMAAPGMGDVLSGIVIALMAQEKVFADVTSTDLAVLGVCLHAAAAEQTVGDKTRGLLASDVINAIASVVQ